MFCLFSLINIVTFFLPCYVIYLFLLSQTLSGSVNNISVLGISYYPDNVPIETSQYFFFFYHKDPALITLGIELSKIVTELFVVETRSRLISCRQNWGQEQIN